MNDLNQSISRWRLASFWLALGLILFSLIGLITNGIALGIDFTGGYLTEFATITPIEHATLKEALREFLPTGFTLSGSEGGTVWSVVQPDTALSLKGKEWLITFSKQSGINLLPNEAMYIGSQIGSELIEQGGLALLTAIFAILVYVSIRFEWRLALGAVFALFHDVIIVLGIFAWLQLPFDLTTLASLLAIIGYSLNDSIIAGDKVRELMMQQVSQSLDDIINSAIKQIWVRTVITSGTTLATVVAVWCVAGASLAGFAVALFCGIIVGTFSSISLAVTVPQLMGLSVAHYARDEEVECQLP